MGTTSSCPVCRNVDGGTYRQLPNRTGGDWSEFDCEVCGRFKVTRTALAIEFCPGDTSLSRPQRAAISRRLHKVRASGGAPFVGQDWAKNIGALPNPALQVVNIVRYIGDEVSASGEPIRELPRSVHAIVGSPSREFAFRLVEELIALGLVRGTSDPILDDPQFDDVTLSIAGWQKYEEEKRGQIAGNYGVIAMKFEQRDLDAVIRGTMKPAIKKELGYDLLDARDAAKAGIIDNIMRNQIRDAAFVIADLTHENSGAYWEAGYAEGLGKPVIYICEKKKFEDTKTHFDTNHCTTLCWEVGANGKFCDDLVATLRRSLNI